MRNSREMIELTTVRGKKFILNADQILHVEAQHDTIVTCVNGNVYRVSESSTDIINEVVKYQQQANMEPALEDNQ